MAQSVEPSQALAGARPSKLPDGPILVGFADNWPGPEVAWSLLDGGFEVACFARAGSRPALRWSKRVSIAWVAPPEEDAQQTATDLLRLAESAGAAAVFPIDDASLWLLREIGSRLPAVNAGPDPAQVEFALDKRLQLVAAREAGLNVPPTHIASSVEELDQLDSFPLVLKGGTAIERQGRRLIRRRTFVIADREELAATQSDPLLVPPVIVQPFIRGTGEGLFGFAAANGIANWSSHRRLRMVDPQGSGSSACVSTPVDSDLAAGAERLLSSVDWSGLFMLEFLREPSGRAWFIEMNGRAWGSLALARRLGLEYPAWTVRQAFDPAFRPPRLAPNSAVVCRNLGFELIHLARVVRGPRSKALVDWPSRSKTARAVLRVRRSDRWYNWRRGDPMVFVADAFQSVRGWLGAARST